MQTPSDSSLLRLEVFHALPTPIWRFGQIQQSHVLIGANTWDIVTGIEDVPRSQEQAGPLPQKSKE